MDEHKDEYMNGSVLDPLPPPRPRFVEMDELAIDATSEQRNRAVMSLAIAYNAHVPALHKELNEHRGGINHVGRVQQAHGETIDKIHTLLSAMMTASGTHLPPMHDRRESNLVLVDHLTEKAETEFRKRASETPGPGVGDPPEVIAGRLRSMMEEFIAEREARDKARAEAAELVMLRAENDARIENERVTRQTAALNSLKALVGAATNKDLRALARVAIDEAIRKGELTGPFAAAAVDYWEQAVKKAGLAAAKLKSDRRKLALQIIIPLTVSFIGWTAAQAWAKAEGDRRFAEGQKQAPVLVVAPPALLSAVATASATPEPSAVPAAPAAVPRRVAK